MVINHQTQLLSSVISSCHALTHCSLTACNLNLNVEERTFPQRRLLRVRWLLRLGC